MNNNKTLRQLGEEYEAAASQVKRRIDKKGSSSGVLKTAFAQTMPMSSKESSSFSMRNTEK